VLAGDWLYMQAFKMTLAERNCRIQDLLTEVTQLMVEGELLQLNRLRKVDISVDDYLDLIHRKTACLFSACMRVGAILGQRVSNEEMKLGSYGANLGLAFQLVDDMLDFSSTKEKLGKPTGNDLREGKVTLPLIYLLRHCPAAEAWKVERVLSEGGFYSVRFAEILELLRGCGALQSARNKAREFAEIAKNCLTLFPESPYKDALVSLTDLIVERES